MKNGMVCQFGRSFRLTKKGAKMAVWRKQEGGSQNDGEKSGGSNNLSGTVRTNLYKVRTRLGLG